MRGVGGGTPKPGASGAGPPAPIKKLRSGELSQNHRFWRCWTPSKIPKPQGPAEGPGPPQIPGLLERDPPAPSKTRVGGASPKPSVLGNWDPPKIPKTPGFGYGPPPRFQQQESNIPIQETIVKKTPDKHGPKEYQTQPRSPVSPASSSLDMSRIRCNRRIWDFGGFAARPDEAYVYAPTGISYPHHILGHAAWG